MKAKISIDHIVYNYDTSEPIDISIPLRAGEKNVNAWYVDPVKIEPVMTDQFTGSVALGGAVNFNDIAFNPHGNGTHTECVGHISKEKYSINQCLKEFIFPAKVVSVMPENVGEDQIIRKQDIAKAWEAIPEKAKAVVIRTLPNPISKINQQYSNTNPPYLDVEVVDYLLEKRVEHLLIDLPSVDREFDDGVLAAHHRFWNYPESPQLHRTISELIYVPDEVKDGFYLLNFQIASFENDASPSKPTLYRLKPES